MGQRCCQGDTYLPSMACPKLGHGDRCRIRSKTGAGFGRPRCPPSPDKIICRPAWCGLGQRGSARVAGRLGAVCRAGCGPAWCGLARGRARGLLAGVGRFGAGGSARVAGRLGAVRERALSGWVVGGLRGLAEGLRAVCWGLVRAPAEGACEGFGKAAGKLCAMGFGKAAGKPCAKDCVKTAGRLPVREIAGAGVRYLRLSATTCMQSNASR